MATIPAIKTLSASSVEIINVIRNEGTQNYKNYVPKATADADSIRKIGAIIMDNPSLYNEFIGSLMNRVAKQIVTSKMYDNPWAIFKKGLLEMGETINEIFVNIAKPYQYDPEQSQSTVFKREMPDVRSAFHVMNYQKFYKTTVQQEQLRQAFLSWQGVTDLIAKIIEQLYTGANYDEFLTMKYMLATHIIQGRMTPIAVPSVSATNMNTIVATIKGASNKLEFMSNKYNVAGVNTHTMKDDQYLLVNTDFDAVMDVEVMASAFNMDKVKFAGKRILVDSFGTLDNERLAILFKDDPNYTEIEQSVLDALDDIPAVLVDKDWFMIYDNLFNFTEQPNGEGMYWNYWYHVWKTFSVSPFANNAIFVAGTPVVNSVAVSPATVTLAKGQSTTFNASVSTAFFAQKTVNWTVDSTLSTIDNSGKLTIGTGETDTSLTVTATSVFDGTKIGTATVTVSA